MCRLLHQHGISALLGIEYYHTSSTSMGYQPYQVQNTTGTTPPPPEWDTVSALIGIEYVQPHLLHQHWISALLGIEYYQTSFTSMGYQPFQVQNTTTPPSPALDISPSRYRILPHLLNQHGISALLVLGSVAEPEPIFFLVGAGSRSRLF